VILVARKLEGSQGLSSAVKALKDTIPGCEDRISAIACDLSKFSEVQRLAEEIGKITPRIHILIANAGATWGGPLETTPDSSISKVLDLNVRSIINLARL
jgi:NAD(P)-dependent dehydrogenase (short-subunit alcohol dehydrogenase family)